MTEAQWPGKVQAAVIVGSAVGAVVRHVVSGLLLVSGEAGFPWGTLAVNMAGSLLIGFFASLIEPGGRLLTSPAAREFVMAGLLGGFTTFSIFSLETVVLVLEGRVVLGAVNVAAALLLWVPAAWVGHVLGRHMNRLRRSGW